MATEVGEGPMAGVERNKYLLRQAYRDAQRGVLPGTIPGEGEGGASHAGAALAHTVISAQEPPGGVNEPSATIAAIAGWHAQTVGPQFTSFGPMIGDDACVVEEWESHFHGGDGTMYNNFYCWVKRFDGDEVVEVREYVDSHHAYVILGLHAPWLALEPPRGPRRRWRPMAPPEPAHGLADHPGDERETVFDITAEFELDPGLLVDPVPASGPPYVVPPTAEGAKQLIRRLHDAQARGDQTEAWRAYAPGFRHFLAGERPFGWDHLPLEQIYAPLVSHLASPITVRFGPLVAEGGRVFEEMEIFARLDDGTVYDNWHCCIHEVRDGRIVQTREYLDTHHAWVVLGRWADWGRTPVPPLTRSRRSNLPYVDETFQGRNPFLELERWAPVT
jgi:ketosteroid isomerase-like protein